MRQKVKEHNKSTTETFNIFPLILTIRKPFSCLCIFLQLLSVCRFACTSLYRSIKPILTTRFPSHTYLPVLSRSPLFRQQLASKWLHQLCSAINQANPLMNVFFDGRQAGCLTREPTVSSKQFLLLFDICCKFKLLLLLNTLLVLKNWP